jgi:hypothetical protein
VSPADDTPDESEQRRRARRNAILLGALAFLIYVGFIIATGLRD